MFWYVPLEFVDGRYTKMMYDLICRDLEREEIPYGVVSSLGRSAEPALGQFLSWAGRTEYSAGQTARIAQLFGSGDVHNGDVFFFADIWHAGLEFVRYMSTMLSLDVRIYAIQHAGVFDPTDLIHPLLPWGQFQELAWYHVCDAVFVGSEYLKRLILAGLPTHASLMVGKIVVTGQVWDGVWVRRLADTSSRWPVAGEYRRSVVWPHRLSPEKHVETFMALARELNSEFPDVSWTVTGGGVDGGKWLSDHVQLRLFSKADFYAFLRAERVVVVSTAEHENWGYSIHEATVLGVPILCPRKACYPELVLTEENLYGSYDELVTKMRAALLGRLGVAKLREQTGFMGMLSHMGVLANV